MTPSTSNNFKWHAGWRHKHSIAAFFDIRLRQKNDSTQCLRWWNVYDRMCCKCARSERGVAVCTINNFFSILYIKRVNVQQLIDNLMHGETKALIWTQPRPTSKLLCFRLQWWAPPSASPTIADESIITLNVGLSFVQMHIMTLSNNYLFFIGVRGTPLVWFMEAIWTQKLIFCQSE